MRLKLFLAMTAAMGFAVSAHAQWLTQTIQLKAGWSAVYLHVDPSYDTIHNLAEFTPIQEVWMWTPNPATQQFVQTPQEPLGTGSQWISWKRATSTTESTQKLAGNLACLVYSTTDYTWNLKGRPALPNHQWTTSGLNFLGFPTAPVNPPSFEDFLSQIPALQQSAEIYEYPGGEFGAGNPRQVFAYRTTPVRRGQAFWMRTGNLYNRYYGPFELVASNPAGVNFGDSLSTASLRLRNLTAAGLTVTLRLVASEAPPTGQPGIAGAPPLLVRGSLNTTDLTYGHSGLPVEGSQTWELAAAGQPGSDVEVVLGLNRSAITADAGSLLAGVLRFTDSLGQSQVDLPVSATAASTTGLWVGSAAITQVGHYLKSYQSGPDGALVTSTDPADFGAYITTSTNTSLGAVPRPFPLRLIVHNPAAGGAVLLQQVFTGLDASASPVVATRESVLNPALLSQARRISATHLPWTEANAGWSFNGLLGPAATLTASVTTGFDDQASNPFLHTYHPDHDNRDATFKNALPQGAESYTIVRDITLEVTPPADDFASLTAAGRHLAGAYVETIRLLGLARAGGTNDTRQFVVRGAFSLHRINAVSTLTTP